MIDYETILIEREGRVARVSFNRPDKLNSFNGTLRREFVMPDYVNHFRGRIRDPNEPPPATNNGGGAAAEGGPPKKTQKDAASDDLERTTKAGAATRIGIQGIHH